MKGEVRVLEGSEGLVRKLRMSKVRPREHVNGVIGRPCWELHRETGELTTAAVTVGAFQVSRWLARGRTRTSNVDD